MLDTPGIKDVLLLLLYAAWCLSDFRECCYLQGFIQGVRVGEVAIGMRVGGAATVTVVWDVKVHH